MRTLTAGAGIAELALAASLAWSLSSRQPLGFIGGTALLATPGILLICWAIALRALRTVPPVLTAGVSLLGLDVVDSSRTVIVAVEYAWFLFFTLLALGLLVHNQRNHPSRQSVKMAG